MCSGPDDKKRSNTTFNIKVNRVWFFFLKSRLIEQCSKIHTRWISSISVAGTHSLAPFTNNTFLEKKTEHTFKNKYKLVDTLEPFVFVQQFSTRTKCRAN